MKTAFPNLRSPVQITLYSNIPFDNTYSNHTMISRKFTDDGDNIYSASDDTYGLPKERFINRRKTGSNDYYYPRWVMTGEFNFNYANGLVTSVALELTPAQTNANYMKVVCGEDIYYYFITSINQANYETYVLSLELDVLMTYQDEFLEGIADKPVFTERKHCHRYWENNVCSPDYKSGDNLFAGIKPSIIKDIKKTYLKIDDYIQPYSSSWVGKNRKMSGVLWLYFITDITEGTNTNKNYVCKGNSNPFSICVAPINARLTLQQTSGGTTSSYSIHLQDSTINKLIGSGHIKGCKVLPYPPFEIADKTEIYDITSTDNQIFINAKYGVTGSGLVVNPTEGHWWIPSSRNTGFTFDYEMFFGDTMGDNEEENNILAHTLIIYDENVFYKLLSTIDFDDSFAVQEPTIGALRQDDPKLLFAPFRKYSLCSASATESEFYPELKCSRVVGYNDVDLETITSCYVGDYSMFTYITPVNTAYEHYKDAKIGLSSTPNYSIPVGLNALDVFKTTQSETFYQSKIASGITSGLTILGGVGLTAVGVVTENPMLITGGITSITGGTANMVNTIKSTESKIEDLKNTPDSITISGASYVHDISMDLNNLLPYVLVYECNETTKQKANDYLYQFGWEVGRDCYFNTETYFENDLTQLDNNLFGRAIFNYIKINEDITNKIDYDMPIIIKKKLSSIFNQGITIWNFFGFYELWRNRTTQSSNLIDNYFMKHTYDNSEYYGGLY